jgi:hypothetical protein
MGSLLLLGSGCSSTPAAVATDTTIASASADKTTTSKEATTTTEDLGGPDTSTKSVKGTTTVKKATPTTAAKLTDAQFAQAAIEAFKGKLGEFKALELTVNFNSASSRAQLEAQDPAKPANVDAYEFTGSAVSGPEPVKLTGDGNLEENLFSVTEVAWEKLPDLFEQAKASIGELEGSTGVTHFIVKKNLPFDSDTVINIYIDGGTRSSGGYVSFQANGTLKKVYGPS